MKQSDLNKLAYTTYHFLLLVTLFNNSLLRLLALWLPLNLRAGLCRIDQ